MSRLKTRPEASKALIELRRRLGETQESLARRLNVTLHSVALWETKRPPGGYALLRLRKLARECQELDLVEAFADALKNEKPRAFRELRQVEELWDRMFEMLQEIHATPEAGQRIRQLARDVEEQLYEAQDWAWRNQRVSQRRPTHAAIR